MGQSGPGSNDNEGVLCIPQSSNITGASPSDFLVSYPGHLLEKSYPSAETLLVYSAALANWVTWDMFAIILIHNKILNWTLTLCPWDYLNWIFLFNCIK